MGSEMCIRDRFSVISVPSSLIIAPGRVVPKQKFNERVCSTPIEETTHPQKSLLFNITKNVGLVLNTHKVYGTIVSNNIQ